MLCIMHNSLYMDDDQGKGFCFPLEKAHWKGNDGFLSVVLAYRKYIYKP